MQDKPRTSFTGLTLVLALTLSGCSSGQLRPVEVRWNEEMCSHCRMTLSEKEFACQWVRPSGTVFYFDDIGCLTTWLRKHAAENSEGVFVTDFNSGSWLQAQEAVYLRSSQFKTPMGSGLAAFRSRVEVGRAQQRWDGELLAWKEVWISPDPGLE